MSTEELLWTGERFLPARKGNIFAEHMHRYYIASSLAKGKRILDIASGEGYGSNILAQYANNVIGVDISSEAINFAKNRYIRPNLEFRVGSAAQIPVEDNTIDLVVSFETIEHHDKHDEMMREIKRVLKKNGTLLISCPDKRNYTDIPGVKNEYHVKELYKEEFTGLISRYFTHARYYQQKMSCGSFIFPEHEAVNLTTYYEQDNKIFKSPGLNAPLYNIAVASDGLVDNIEPGIFEISFFETDAYSELLDKYGKLNNRQIEKRFIRLFKLKTIKKFIQRLTGKQ